MFDDEIDLLDNSNTELPLLVKFDIQPGNLIIQGLVVIDCFLL